MEVLRGRSFSTFCVQAGAWGQVCPGRLDPTHIMLAQGWEGGSETGRQGSVLRVGHCIPPGGRGLDLKQTVPELAEAVTDSWGEVR